MRMRGYEINNTSKFKYKLMLPRIEEEVKNTKAEKDRAAAAHDKLLSIEAEMQKLRNDISRSEEVRL